MTEEIATPKPIGEVLKEFNRRIDEGMYSPFRDRIPQENRVQKWISFLKLRGHRYSKCSFDNFETKTEDAKTVCDKLIRFAENMPDAIQDGSGLFLYGPPGTGKDHLTVAALRQAVLRHGFTVEWHDGLRLYHRIKKAISENRTEDMLSSLVKPQILALSDPVPARGELTTYELCILRDLVERRYSKCISTWITTNAESHEEAERLFTKPILDRLGHGAHAIFCNWPSYRTGA